MQALDRFIANYTNDEIVEIRDSGGERRKSFDPPEGTAYSGIKKVVTNGEYRLVKNLESTIFKFAIGGKPVIIEEDYGELVEVGVAALSKVGSTALVDERGNGSQRYSGVITSDDDLKRRWEDVKPRLVGRDGSQHGCVRFMIQYPCDSTRSANPGVLEDDEVKVAEKKRPKKKLLVALYLTEVILFIMSCHAISLQITRTVLRHVRDENVTICLRAVLAVLKA